jgi:copper(I)-binding protein
MKRVFSIAGVLALAIAAAQAHSIRAGELEVVHPVIVVPQAGAANTCAHLRIINHGEYADYLRGIRLDIAGGVKFIIFKDEENAEISPVRLAIPPGQSLELRAPTYCIFLLGLSISLEADVGSYRGTLLFERAGQFDVDFMVVSP